MTEKYYLNWSHFTDRWLVKERPNGDVVATFDKKKDADDFIKYKKKGECVLDYSDIDDYDEISGDQQMTFIWCETHKQYEWHWLLKRENI